ncbi:Outer membrane protein beta-barrel domain-containing protein [Catalinimonas alkaloidigena]|uniref:Outer membrane protein beta-barrel domain-containing protein n=1 Tax=Catalinimonas alkaloidigena TaxID=1075417 RepID=A0A1G9B1D1_9BACT|nr:porin family protein [Catalinimonas alkaloidigena]SDK33337.1 Outer membrane protein beta-barrel domain-containing protein [Catalinimonas alkaloidigena]
MKKALFVLIFCLVGAHASRAQFTIGPKVGVNYSNLSSNLQSLEDEPITGFHAGVFARLGGRLHLQPEAYLIRRGSDLRFKDTGHELLRGEVRYNSIDVPILLGYKLIDGGLVNLRLMGGPVASFIMSTDEDGVTEWPSENNRYEDQVWGIQGGLGLDVGNLTLDVRYETGLQDINQGLRQRPHTFNVSLGWKLL